MFAGEICRKKIYLFFSQNLLQILQANSLKELLVRKRLFQLPSCKAMCNLDRTGQGWWVQPLYFEMIWNRSQGYEGLQWGVQWGVPPPGRSGRPSKAAIWRNQRTDRPGKYIDDDDIGDDNDNTDGEDDINDDEDADSNMTGALLQRYGWNI